MCVLTFILHYFVDIMYFNGAYTLLRTGMYLLLSLFVLLYLGRSGREIAATALSMVLATILIHVVIEVVGLEDQLLVSLLIVGSLVTCIYLFKYLAWY